MRYHLNDLRGAMSDYSEGYALSRMSVLPSTIVRYYARK